MKKKLSYRISSEAYTLQSILEDYGYSIGSYRIYINNRWILNPQVLNNLILNPTFEEIEEGKLAFNCWEVWQDLLRQMAYYNQQGKSLLTNKILNVKTMQLHHALITRGMVQGKKGLDKYLIHHSYNVMLLNRDEHLDGHEGADNRELCAKKLCLLYGGGQVRLWYFSFPMKSKLPNIF